MMQYVVYTEQLSHFNIKLEVKFTVHSEAEINSEKST